MGITLNRIAENLSNVRTSVTSQNHHHRRHRTCRKGDVRTPNGKPELHCGALDKSADRVIGRGEAHTSHMWLARSFLDQRTRTFS
jgi:hypothetical protein